MSEADFAPNALLPTVASLKATMTGFIAVVGHYGPTAIECGSPILPWGWLLSIQVVLRINKKIIR
jgi:hypothetical protein